MSHYIGDDCPGGHEDDLVVWHDATRLYEDVSCAVCGQFVPNGFDGRGVLDTGRSGVYVCLGHSLDEYVTARKRLQEAFE